MERTILKPCVAFLFGCRRPRQTKAHCTLWRLDVQKELTETEQ